MKAPLWGTGTVNFMRVAGSEVLLRWFLTSGDEVGLAILSMLNSLSKTSTFSEQNDAGIGFAHKYRPFIVSLFSSYRTFLPLLADSS
jgi:hypothetical protein